MQRAAVLVERVISIHTSPKGGDDLPAVRFGDLAISIHTSPKGGDQTTIQKATTRSGYFNPHLPEGR